ncbi:MAG TPA: hypothetical protein VIU11_01985 [Nakamurella sp.]
MAAAGRTPATCRPFVPAFFTAANGDCNQIILNAPIPSWYQDRPLSGSTVRDLVPPDGIIEVDTGSSGIVACMGAKALPTGPCVEPIVALSGALSPPIREGCRGRVPKACIIVLPDVPSNSDPEVGFAIADDQGTWQVAGLPLQTPMVVAVIPAFTGPDGPARPTTTRRRPGLMAACSSSSTATLGSI